MSLDRTWSVVRGQWVAKWKMVTRASDMAAKRGGYESAAALRSGATANLEAPSFSVTSVSRSNFDAVAEYAAALKAENLELRSIDIDGASTISSLPDTVAATTTSSTTTAVIAEMKRAQEVQAVAHAAQIAQLNIANNGGSSRQSALACNCPGRGWMRVHEPSRYTLRAPPTPPREL